jgi:hypothetical protein
LGEGNVRGKGRWAEPFWLRYWRVLGSVSPEP